MFVDSRQICATVEMVKFVEIDSSCDYLLFSYCTFCDFWSLNRAHLTLKRHHRLHVSNLWMYVTLPAEHNRYSDSLPKIAGGNLQLSLHYYKHLWAARCGRSDWIGGTRWTALVMYWRTVLKGEFRDDVWGMSCQEVHWVVYWSPQQHESCFSFSARVWLLKSDVTPTYLWIMKKDNSYRNHR